MISLPPLTPRKLHRRHGKAPQLNSRRLDSNASFQCHDAARVAAHAKRNKIKVDDFKFTLRRDPKKLGRVEELLHMAKVITDARKQFDDKIDAKEADAK